MGHRAFRTPDVDRPIVERLRPAAGGLALLLVALVVGWWLLRPASAPVEASLPMAPTAGAPGSGSAPARGAAEATPSDGSTAVVSTSTTAPALIVQAAGAVAEPGVYELPAGSRIVDLVDEAGGLSSEADRQRINLAAPVADGERVWIPARGEDRAPDVIAGGSSGGGAPASTGSAAPPDAAAPDEPIDLNAATAEQLDTLPGVGPATASAILSHRETNGPFTSVDELLDVRGIGEAKLEQLRPLVRV
jgi:competence protein ComEA